MHRQPPLHHGARYGRLRLQVQELGYHVAANQGCQFGMLPFRRIRRLAMAPRALDVA
jgi:hypothetical protein